MSFVCVCCCCFTPSAGARALSLSLSDRLSSLLFPHKIVVFWTMKFCDELHSGVFSLWSARNERRRLWMLLQMLLVFVVAVKQVSAGSKTRGISPQDLEYFDSATIWCKDGTKRFPRERLNDNFCDCADGTDEPGTSACLEGKFYCKDIGITPRRVFSSRVNDGICDCCDGSDEYEKQVKCTNRCSKGPQRQQHTKNITMHVEDSRLKGLVIKLKDMKGPLLLQMLGFCALFWWQCVVWVRVIRRALSKKRRASHTSFL